MITRQRLGLIVGATLTAGVVLMWWTCTPDRDAIAALLGDVRVAVESGDLEPALPAFRRDFVFGEGRGGGAVVTYDELATVGNRELRRGGGFDEVEVRNVEIEIDGEHAEVRAVVQLKGGGNELLTARPLPIRVELTRGEDRELYRGWRLHRAALRRLDE